MLQFYQGAPPHQMKVFSPAIFAPDGTLRVRVNDAVPSINNRAGIKTLGEPCGDAVKATLYDNEAISKNDDDLLLGGLLAGPVKVAARENQPITGQTGDVRLKKIITFDGNGLDYFFLAQLQGSNVSAKTDMALCVASGDGTVRALVREGDMLGGKSVTTIATLVAMKASLAEDRWRASANGFGVRLTFDDKTQAYFTVPSSATLPTDWKQWLVTESAFDTAKVATLGFPAFGDLGPAAVITLKSGTQPADKKHDVLVVRVDNTDATVFATEGNSAPDANGTAIPGATFKTFSEPVAGKSGRTAFMATLAGVTPTAGIWYSADGDHLKLLARVGDAAPGGGVWSAFTQLVLPGGATSGPHFLGTLKTDATAGISKANNTGIWSVKSNGVLDLTLRNGTSLDVPDPRTLKSFVALATAPDSLGAARGYDDAGQIAVLATFTDNSVALLRLAVP